MENDKRVNDRQSFNWPYEDRRKNDLINNLYLDPSILQSRTTLTLVSFIDELWVFLNQCRVKDINKLNDLTNKYESIKAKADKAKNKRSIKL